LYDRISNFTADRYSLLVELMNNKTILSCHWSLYKTNMDIWNDNSNLRKWLLPSVGPCNRSLLYFYEKLCLDTYLWYPIRRGLVVLPKAEENTWTTQVRGYGYCTETNQHKVLRIIEKPRSWRRIGFVPYSYYDNVFLVTFNGVMYWFVAYTEILFDQICSFRIRNQPNRQISYHPNL
jgi:hypothetical protein